MLGQEERLAFWGDDPVEGERLRRERLGGRGLGMILTQGLDGNMCQLHSLWP